MKYGLIGLIYTVLGLVYASGFSVVGDEITKKDSQAMLTAAWKNVVSNYEGKSFSLKREKATDVFGLKRVSVSLVSCDLHVISQDFYRMDGTTSSSSPDISKVDHKKSPEEIDLSAIPLRTDRNAFASIYNPDYSASLSTLSAAKLGQLSKSGDKVWPFEPDRFFPGLCFDLTSCLLTDLDWEVEDYKSIPSFKYVVESFTLKDGDGELRLIRGEGGARYIIKLRESKFFSIDSWENSFSSEEGSHVLKGTVTYGTHECHPQRMISVREVKSKKHKGADNISAEFTQLVPTKYSSSDCYLSAFDLPEPDFAPKKSFALLWTFVVVGLSLCAIFIWRRFRK